MNGTRRAGASTTTIHMQEEIAIIVPVYNRAKVVERTLDSIAAQTYRPLHLIVVDNGSTDSSRAVCTAWAARNAVDGLRVTMLDEQARGAAAARNRGLAEADSPAVMFFDSDDVMRPTLVEKVMGAFRADPSADMVTWQVLIHNLDGTKCRTRPGNADTVDCHMIHSLLRTHGYAARRSLWKLGLRWNERLPVWNDWELGVRILLARPRTTSVNEVLADILAQPESITGIDFQSKAGQWEAALDAAAAAITASTHQRRAHMLRLVLYRRVILAAHYRREKRPDLASELLTKTLDSPLLSRSQRRSLRFAYNYTAAGGRGAYRLIRYMI